MQLDSNPSSWDRWGGELRYGGRMRGWEMQWVGAEVQCEIRLELRAVHALLLASNVKIIDQWHIVLVKDHFIECIGVLSMRDTGRS